MVGLFHQPAGHLGDIAIGLAVRRAAPSNTTPVVVGSGMSSSLMHLRRLRRSTSRIGSHAVRCGPYKKFGAGAVLAGVLNGFRNLHLHVACRIQDERQHQHAAGVAPGVQQNRRAGWGRKLDEAHLDIPAGLACAPLGHKAVDFVVALRLARAVADEQDGVFVACAVVCTEGVAGVCIRKSPWAWQAHWPCESGG